MRNNKIIILFLIKFFGTYALLFFLYAYYLKKTQVKADTFSCAPITKTVSKQAISILNLWGYQSEAVQNTQEMSMRVEINGHYIARVNEGCNSLSIIILFISFIVAFSSTFKATALYILFGSLLIYGVNILRISIIAVAMYEYPSYQKILHDLVFPSIIYGLTFVLWFVWVRIFLKPNTNG